jgi:hypothetical protein
MPSTRQPINRQLLPRVGSEVLELFVKLERQRPAKRDKAEVRKLCELLGLEDEYWSGEDVLCRDKRPCHPPGYLAYDAFFKCRAIRLALLEATGLTSRMNRIFAKEATGTDDDESAGHHRPGDPGRKSPACLVFNRNRRGCEAECCAEVASTRASAVQNRGRP